MSERVRDARLEPTGTGLSSPPRSPRGVDGLELKWQDDDDEEEEEQEEEDEEREEHLAA